MRQRPAGLASDVTTLNGTSDERREVWLGLRRGISTVELGYVVLPGNVTDALIRDCGDTGECPCPAGMQRAEHVGRGDDRNSGTDGTYVYLWVSRY